MIKKLNGWGDYAVVLLIIGFVSYGFYVKIMRNKNASYTKGVSLGISKGVKGSKYLDYKFFVNGEEIKGFVTSDFCKECNYKCCTPGDTVIVRYETDDVKNNDLVPKIPDGVDLK